MDTISLGIIFGFDEKKCQKKIEKRNKYLQKNLLFNCEMFY